MTTSNLPRIIDNDRDEITVTLDGKEIRGWSYASEAERRTKMLAAREFVEGWYQARDITDDMVERASKASVGSGWFSHEVRIRAALEAALSGRST